MRTAIVIMLSDFMETVILVGQIGSDVLKKKFNQAFQANELSGLIKQLIEGSKDLSDIEFDIKLMRNVVMFLTEGRSGVSENDRKAFRQFVGEYNGNNFVSGVEAALSNNIHEVAIAIIDKFKNDTVKQSSLETLQCYCDRMESALMSLFSIHKYLQLYEIITVGKVEAYRRRDRRYISICHDIFNPPLTSAESTTYGMNFAENYSALIVTHRTNFLDYLSLSPFVIDVGLFNEKPNSQLFLFNGMKNNYLEYIDAEGKSTIQINLNSAAASIVNVDDRTFLRFEPEMTVAKAPREVKIRARQRFARVKDQFKKITLLYLLLTRDKKTKAAPLV
jgi:hypothetical protein